MPKDVTILQVFAASPSDVTQERDALDRAISKLNLAISPMLGVRLELIRWETHAYPDFGEDAQDVINCQLPSDYDIFVGMLWGRFGTPTKRANSGTHEEFHRALMRHRAGDRVKVLVYFKDAPLQPSQVDPTQLGLVLEFKKMIEVAGGLHWTFTDNFEELVELHLMRHMQEYQRSRPVEGRPAQERAITVVAVEADEDGILEFMEAYEEHFARLIEVQDRIAKAIAYLGERMTARAEEVNRANAEGHKGDIPYIRRIALKTAEDMTQFVARMDVDLPIFATEFEAGFRAFINGIAASRDFNDSDNVEDMRTMLHTVDTVHANMKEARSAVQGLRDTVATLPRITTVLNRAKRATVAVLDRLLTDFNSAETLLVEAHDLLTSHLRK
jgi:hypothetical protein